MAATTKSYREICERAWCCSEVLMPGLKDRSVLSGRAFASTKLGGRIAASRSGAAIPSRMDVGQTGMSIGDRRCSWERCEEDVRWN